MEIIQRNSQNIHVTLADMAQNQRKLRPLGTAVEGMVELPVMYQIFVGV